MNKRERVLSLLEPDYQAGSYTPAAFFLHFDAEHHFGQAGVEKHLEYFHYTDMDFVKIQYERGFPRLSDIQRPEDWQKIPLFPLEYYAPQLDLVKGLVKAAKAEALVILTLYSPFMLAGQMMGEDLVSQHIRENPQAVQRGMQIITESLMGFVKACVGLGLDGFYTSTQGGEEGRFGDSALFDQCIRPYDLALMEEIDRTCIFNILHVCDYHLPYRSLAQFVNYPGHVVNASLDLTGETLTAQAVADMFGRPFMGGLERKGLIATGSPAEIQQAAAAVLESAPERFVLGADCTVPAGTSWDNLRAAIATAHNFERN